MNITAALSRGSNGIQSAALEASIVVFSDDECSHDVFHLINHQNALW
jgi:hypothetical protein